MTVHRIQVVRDPVHLPAAGKWSGMPFTGMRNLPALDK